MTVEQAPQAGGAVQAWGGDTGLEDFAVSDAVLPRIRIEQTKGLWSENLGNQEFQILRFIPLGLVKQRVLFHHQVEDGDVPMCKSSDFEVGFPNPQAKQGKTFPWDKSGFDPQNFPPNAAGFTRLPCEGCQLKEWGSNPATDAPYCAEQWTLPIYFDVAMDNTWAPAILTLQKSSIKPIRAYYTSYATSGNPPFIHIAQGSLQVTQRGQTTYSIPKFVKEGESPRERWEEFQAQFKDMRAFLRRPPYREDEADQPAPSDNVNRPPESVQVQTPPPAPVVQTPPPSPVQSGDPWATTAQPAPLPEQPVAPQPVAPAAEVAPPVQPPAPVAQPAPPPVQQAPTPQPVQPQAPAPVEAPPPTQVTQPAPVQQQAPPPAPVPVQQAPSIPAPAAQPVQPQQPPAPAAPAVPEQAAAPQAAPPAAAAQDPMPQAAAAPPPAGDDLPF